MTPEDAFRRAATSELARLKPLGFDRIREERGPGYESYTLFRGVQFIELVREIRDQLVYAELGRLQSGRMPGSKSSERIDLRQLTPNVGSLGSYEETAEGIAAAVREVVDALVVDGIPHLDDV